MLRLLGTRFIFRINKSFLIKNENKKIQYVQNNFLWHQNINFNLNDVDDLEEKTDKKKKKSPKIPKITLIHPNNSITITQLEDAEKLADRRNLQLVHVSDESKNNRQIYKLVEYSKIKEEEKEEEKKEKKEKECDKKKVKSTKLFTIKSDIMDYDLNVKINNINKVLKKKHKVKIFFIHPDGIRDGIIKNVKSKVQGIFSEEKKKGSNTVFIYSPSENENISSKDNTV